MDQVLEGLHLAKAHLERGWCKYAAKNGVWYGGLDRTTTVCILGAIQETVNHLYPKTPSTDPDRTEFYGELSNRIYEMIPPESDCTCISHYNDRGSTRHKDVLHLLDNAIIHRELECQAITNIDQVQTQTFPTDSVVSTVAG